MTTAVERQPRILVVDDDEGVANVVSRALALEGYEVRTAPDGERALRGAREWQPDAVVLDVMLPGTDGLEVCRRLRTQQPDVGVLMLTARDTPLSQITGLDAGADDYLVKPVSLPILAARVRAVLRRHEPASEVLTYEDLSLDTGARRARRGERDIPLTTTEYKLLLHLMRAAGRVVPKALLTERVWGYDFEGNDNILEVYIRYLRHKLEAGGEPRLIQTLRGTGYALRSS